MVPSIYTRDFWDILRQAALTVCVLARLGWASIETDGGGGRRCLRPRCLQFTNKHIQYDPIYTKIWARSWKNHVPRPWVITEHCACASRTMRHLTHTGSP